MDLRRLLQVVARFKLLVALGVIFAVVLALLSFVKIDFKNGPQLTYRKSEGWASFTRVLIAQPGFRYGSSLTGPGSGSTPIEVQTAAESRLPTLATIYSSFVTSDDVRRILLRQGPIRGALEAQAMQAPNGGAVLPIVSITALSDSATNSRSLGNRAAAALARYVDAQQEKNGVPPAERIQLRVLNRAGQTELVNPRSKTLPMAVFLVVMFATIGLAFVLENLRPKRLVLSEAEALPPSDRVQAAS